MKNIAIFASGNGSNAENIINYFADNKQINIKLILANNKNAYVIQRAKNHNINCVIVSRKEYEKSDYVLDIMKSNAIDAIILAGFLWLIPESLIDYYTDRIVNIHPALLPKYGGKGMYGMNVHRAVIEHGEKESGITIHKVNKEYDKGEIIFNAKCKINSDDTAETLAEKVHELEYTYFPKVIEEWLERLGKA